VLAETPPAPDLPAMRALWADVGASGLVQVAEQYLMVPAHAARLEAVRAGVIGTPTQVQVSSTHMYHAISLMRGHLGVGAEPATVRAMRTSAPLVDPLTRDGWTGDDEPRPAGTIIGVLDWGDGRSGVYDFTDNQWHNQLRFRRLVVRGTHGELRDDEVVRLLGPETIARTPLVRRIRPGPGRLRDGQRHARRSGAVPESVPRAPLERRGDRHRVAAGPDGGVGPGGRLPAVPVA
jgi:predicted dehydrogenase